MLSFLTTTLFAQPISWQQLNGPFGGTPLCFATNSNGDLFAGTDQNQRGVFKSTDNGEHWLQKSNGISLTDRAVNWITVDDSGYVIAGTGSHIGSGVYKSKDNGESWSLISSLGGICVAKNDSGHIYVGNTGYGQYSVSKDGGYTWTHYSHPSPFINCIEINDSGHIFIGGNYTGYRSTDNGVSWTNLSLPDGINSFAFSPNGDLYAGCSREYASNSGVYKSTDNGDSWTPVKEGFRVYPTDNIVINNSGEIFVGSYGWGIWRSTDEGVTWTQQNSGLGHSYIKSMYIAENGYIYAGTSGGGIYRSENNGETWQQVGLTVAGVKTLAISPVSGFIFASVSGMSRSTNSGITWEPINSGISSRDVVSSEIKNIAIKPDGTIFIGYATNFPSTLVYRSTDNGSNWVSAQTGIQGGEILGLTIDDSGYVYASTDWNGVYKSTNNGNSWSNIGNPSQGGKLAFNSIGDLFLASYGGGLWKLPAGDTIWVDLTSNYGSNWLYSLFISKSDYLYTDGSRSTDNGLTWTTMSIGNMAYSYAENSAGHLFADTFNYGSGVKRSTDYGVTWESINSGIPTNDVRAVAIDSNDYLYAGPWGYSLFKSTTSTITSVEHSDLTPESFSLSQNYPNPFNPRTTIQYSIPSSQFVTIKVYDIIGRDILTLVNEHKEAGSYKVYFMGDNIPSGIYFYRLHAGPFEESKKLILLK